MTFPFRATLEYEQCRGLVKDTPAPKYRSSASLDSLFAMKKKEPKSAEQKVEKQTVAEAGILMSGRQYHAMLQKESERKRIDEQRALEASMKAAEELLAEEAAEALAKETKKAKRTRTRNERRRGLEFKSKGSTGSQDAGSEGSSEKLVGDLSVSSERPPVTDQPSALTQRHLLRTASPLSSPDLLVASSSPSSTKEDTKGQLPSRAAILSPIQELEDSEPEPPRGRTRYRSFELLSTIATSTVNKGQKMADKTAMSSPGGAPSAGESKAMDVSKLGKYQSVFQSREGFNSIKPRFP
jgi:hypothetical protein